MFFVHQPLQTTIKLNYIYSQIKYRILFVNTINANWSSRLLLTIQIFLFTLVKWKFVFL